MKNFIAAVFYIPADGICLKHELFESEEEAQEFIEVARLMEYTIILGSYMGVVE